ncbi:hypothetical protein [Aurantiacibacter flavus]|uniref:Uncharacterized protein n=1 Tax=Aurantiacibacter flavus TaxID=3145232 RepID=A0ABV0D1Q1_9SPHN
MYEWLDRPLSRLDARDSLLVWSTRRWQLDMDTTGCGCTRVGPAFHACGMITALPFFEIAMTIVRHAKIEPFVIGGDTVSEDEAILLSLIDQAGWRPRWQMMGRLEGFVAPAKVVPLVSAFTRLAPLLTSVSRSPRQPS